MTDSTEPSMCNIFGEVLRAGVRVGTEAGFEHEHGTVVSVREDQVTVDWDVGVRTTRAGTALRRVEAGCEQCSER